MRKGSAIPVVGLALFFFATLAVAEQPMTGPQIETALSDRTAFYESGEKQFFAAYGGTPYLEGDRLTSGRWQVRGDQYCSTWPPSTHWACYDMVQYEDGRVAFIGDSGRRYVARMLDGNRL